MPQRLLLLELNELTPRLINKFIDQGLLPNFKKLRDQAHVFVTDAQEEHLEPWIQWVTVHTGLSFDEHQIFHLNDCHKLTKPSLWDLVSSAGSTVWVCGNMNAKFTAPIRGWVLPDPWTESKPFPAEFGDFARFVRAQVQEHTNERAPLSKKDAFDFVRFAVTHGLRLSTMVALAKQVISERFGDTRWHRAAFLDRVQWDVFKWYYEKHRPVFSTVFLNSTAHYQHVYWRHMEPEHYNIKPKDDSHRDVILYGYQNMDRIVGEAMAMAGDDTILVFASALSQKPFLDFEDEGAKTPHRPYDLQAFPKNLGLPTCRVVPVMAEQFYLYFENQADRDAAHKTIVATTCNGEPMFYSRCEHEKDIFVSSSVYQEQPADAKMVLPNGQKHRFYDLFYVMRDNMKAATHHPDGLFWVRMPDAKHSIHPNKIPLTAAAPTILNLMGIPAPGYMKPPVQVVNHANAIPTPV